MTTDVLGRPGNAFSKHSHNPGVFLSVEYQNVVIVSWQDGDRQTRQLQNFIGCQKQENAIFNLTTIPAVAHQFFANHIRSSLNAPQIKACRFRGNSRVQKSVQRIAQRLDDIPLFVRETQDLTRFLFTTMKSTSSRSSGTLFFLIYSDTHSTHLGILKMDPNQGLQIDRVRHTLRVQENMLPNPEDKLHKCAFIRLGEPSEAVHLHVLDRQQTLGDVSKFFLNTFLEADEVPNVAARLVWPKTDGVPCPQFDGRA